MSFSKWFLLLPFIICACQSQPVKRNIPEDKYLWLEEVEGEKAIQFAKEENKKTLEHFQKNLLFKNIEKDTRDIYLAKDRVPTVKLRNGELYNFWQDKKNVRGLWRKTSIESFKSGKPKWNIILDLDKLAKKEKENWVWKGSSELPFNNEKILLYLSRGGKDATVVREFNLKTKSFVKDGFNLPEAKSDVSWKDENTVYVGTDFGPDSMTDSGYPRIVKLWKRGTPLSEAQVVIEGKKTDMGVYAGVSFNDEGRYIFQSRRPSFYESENWYETKEGKRIKIPMPADAEFNGIFKEHLLFVLRSDLKNFKSGSLVALPLDKIEEGDNAYKYLQIIFAPSGKKFLQRVTSTKNHLLLGTLDNVLAKIEKVSFEAPDQWESEGINLGENGVAYVTSVEDESDQYLTMYMDFLTPPSVYIGNSSDKTPKFSLLSQSPKRFDAQGMIVERFEATSRDGTSIPYFIVAPKGFKKDGSNPTLLYGYGGFDVALQPSYIGALGKNWVEKGGVYVLANLRGGGEFGPEWHKSVLKENRYKVYEDFVSIAEDLVRRGVTSSKHLGISGRSNGGLLTGATFTSRPDLFGAVIVGVPLLDMLRYHKLLAGASWMAEYGDPDDPQMREAILRYSPYQKVNAETKYPEAFFMTSTKDDRVHPGHARKMVAKMREQGHKVYYYENLEGGHAGSANIEQKVLWDSLEMTYLWEKLGR
ncbi:Prolyl endopeptidase precursor [compost metagenome]